MTENQGISFSGGYVTISGPVAAGPHATANLYAAPAGTPDDALRQVNLLLLLIREHHAALADADVAEQIALKVRAELTAAKPDPDRVLGAVGRLTKRVAAVGALATAGAGLDQAVHALFG